MVLRLLIDTCVWLDLAKDPGAAPVVRTLGDLVESGDVELIVPQMVLTEFERNKDRVITDAKRGMQSHFKLVRQAVVRFGDKETSAETVSALAEVDRQVGLAGESVSETIEDIEKLLLSVQLVPASSDIKQRAVDRAIAGRAPYHRDRNSVGDAIIVETYADLTRSNTKVRRHSAFITHNSKDFSAPDGDTRMPHPDLGDLFDGATSRYLVSLPEVLKELAADLMADYDFEYNFEMQPRRLSELMEAERLLERQVWYNRHWGLRARVESGKISVVPEAQYSRKPYRADQILDTIWEGALAAAKRTEDEVGVDNLGPWTDFEWGMVNGKLSALRWAMGDDWDMLDT